MTLSMNAAYAEARGVLEVLDLPGKLRKRLEQFLPPGHDTPLPIIYGCDKGQRMDIGKETNHQAYWDCSRLYGIREYGKNTFQVVVRQDQLHHATLVVDFDSVPYREGGSSIPFVLPIRPAGRVVKGNQRVTVRRCHRRSRPGGSARDRVRSSGDVQWGEEITTHSSSLQPLKIEARSHPRLTSYWARTKASGGVQTMTGIRGVINGSPYIAHSTRGRRPLANVDRQSILLHKATAVMYLPQLFGRTPAPKRGALARCVQHPTLRKCGSGKEATQPITSHTQSQVNKAPRTSRDRPRADLHRSCWSRLMFSCCAADTRIRWTCAREGLPWQFADVRLSSGCSRTLSGFFASPPPLSCVAARPRAQKAGNLNFLVASASIELRDSFVGGRGGSPAGARFK